MRAFGLSLLVSLGVLASCGGHEARPLAASRVSLLDTPKPSPSDFPTPAMFRYHPHEPGALTTRVTLGDGSVVFAGQRGERWLVPEKATAATPASEIAPEDLVLAQRKEGTFLFLGRSGTTYESTDAIGPFIRSTTPLEPLARVTAAGTVLVGLRKDLTLVRSETGGASWSKVGPEGVAFEDVALRPDGKGLALAVPEALYQTRDSGATFQKTNIPAMGASELILDEHLGLVVGTALGSRVWDGDGDGMLGPLTRPLSPRTLSLGVPVPLGPSATALQEERAAVVDGKWFEVRAGGDPQSYDFVSGTFGAPLVRAPLPFLRGCSEAHLAGARKALYVLCVRQKAPLVTQPFEIRRSTDSGKTWKPEPYTADGRSSELSLAVTDKGELVLSGVCPATLRGSGCRPVGIHVRGVGGGDGGASVDLVPAATPSLAGTPYALLASYDGTTLYALGRRSKGDSLSAFVSHDGGASFDARDVESVKLPEDDGRPRGSSDIVVESASAAEDGTVAFVLARAGRRTWLVLDDDGRVLAVSKPPVENARLGAAGQRGFAVSASGLDAWESLDGGATFSTLGKLSVDPCPGPGECSPRVACTAMGCVLSDVVTRLGWRAAPRTDVLPPPATKTPVRTEQKVGVPYVCALESGEWKRIQGALGPPTAEQTAIGKFAWFVLRHEPGSALVAMTEARLGRDATVEDVPLLPRVPKPAEYAYTASVQIEGAAALRYKLSDVKDGNLKKAEVAWQDALFGHVGHGVIADGGPLSPGDYEEKGTMRLAQPALLSIARGGVYVRLHARAGDAQPTYFVDGRSVESVPEVKWGTAGNGGYHAEVARIGRAHLPLRIDGATVVRASLGGAGWSFVAGSVWLSNARALALDPALHTGIAYAGETAALHVETTAGGVLSGLLYPFRADGRLFDEPVRVPTQRDLPPSPRPCSIAERASTPRVVATLRDGTRHPVVISDAIEPMRVLITADAVLHGTPENPCAAAYDADFVVSEAASLGQAEHGVLLLDPNERSYLFRTAAGSREGASAVEYRSMTCRADPGAEVPREVWNEKGTHIDVF